MDDGLDLIDMDSPVVGASSRTDATGRMAAFAGSLDAMPHDGVTASRRLARHHNRLLPLNVRGLAYQANGQTLLEGVSFAIEQSERVIVLGHNGAGKSLLLRLCHGLICPAAGEVQWGLEPASARRLQAMVFQSPVHLRRSALDNILFALSNAGVPRTERAARAEQALAEVGLSALGARSARVLSGGEQQRLALARAIALEPELLFLDEPTANLDPLASQAIEAALARLHARGCAIVMTTHDIKQARRLADRVLFMHRGHLLENTLADDFFKRPSTPQAQAFLNGAWLDA